MPSPPAAAPRRSRWLCSRPSARRTGTATINEFDDASIEKVVRRAEDLARLAPENPEYVEFLGPQTYLAPPAHFDSTSGLNAEFRAKAMADCINPCKAKNLVAAGFLEHTSGFSSLGNSHGLSGYHRSSGVNYSVTVRTADGLGSGYGVCDFNDSGKLDAKLVSELAMQKGHAVRGNQGARARQIHRHSRAERVGRPDQPHAHRHGRPAGG